MKKGYIYKITSPSGKVYVGQTINLPQRLRQYKSMKKGNQVKLVNSVNKYGWDAHTFEIIEELSYDGNKTELNEREKYWIKEHTAFGPYGLNCTEGGDGQIGRVWTTEQIANLSKAQMGNTSHLGFKNTDESKDRMSKSAKLRGANRKKGFVQSQEVKDKIRKSKLGCVGPNKGKVFSQEAKDNMRKAALNRKK